MVGSGTDTYDPTCDLAPGHAGVCKSFAAVDQHRLKHRCEQCGREGTRGFRVIQPARHSPTFVTPPIVVCEAEKACRKRWPQGAYMESE